MDIGNLKILTRKTSSVNMQTGEVIEQRRLRRKKREKFMLLYVENFSVIVSLTRKSQEVLAQVLVKKVTYGTNEVVLDGIFRAELCEKLKTSRAVISNCIAELVRKKIFKREKRAGGYIFFLNSYLFGQGEWNTIEKQRQQLTIDYDFVNYTAEKEIKTITAYEGLPNQEDIQIVKRENYVDEQGVERLDVLVDTDRKENVAIEAEIEAETPQKQIELSNIPSDFAKEQEIKEIDFAKEQEIALLKEKNKEKELSIKEKELSIREIELKIKMKELEIE
ncbi:hypothetical protein OQH60_01895 [Campylobacter sp. MIT 21-1685]|uniref:hypothetical protein n=1 Tax=unclassified Campylobacter TaxID=2593542 RepID=UPI00224B9A99|nr:MULTISPECIES: hypothetical protein [unclassified Campylobacter]MCX2682677.1 hypothetical protein [Campylobacter sp. MIT 21-1684]MCX2750957.1 hypothetical protein [Campylobacter sp. MIT 21-1682]MCX2807110.1 hypothetical protein [Campylobacter sp. MIT 21-1685]